MPTERTLALLKPDATARPIVGAIVAMAEEAGLRVAAARMGEFGPAAMEDLYAEHAGRPYFADQIAYMVSGPVLALVLEGPDAVATWRGVMGPAPLRRELPAQLGPRLGFRRERGARDRRLLPGRGRRARRRRLIRGRDPKPGARPHPLGGPGRAAYHIPHRPRVPVR
jgi:nucleoside diphosphate kinase